MAVMDERYYPDDMTSFPWEITLSNGVIGKQIIISGIITNYIITKSAKVYNIKTEKILKQFMNTNGYLSVNICLGKRGFYKTKSIHRLLGLAYIANPKKLPVINHKDGNKINLKLDNLEWSTYRYNNIHAYATGLKNPTKSRSGEESNLTKHTKDEVIYVCKKLQKGYTPKALHIIFNIDYSFAQNIYRRITWKEVSINYNFDKVVLYNKNFNFKEIKKIMKLYHNGLKPNGIIRYMNWEYSEKLRSDIRQLIRQIDRYDKISS